LISALLTDADEAPKLEASLAALAPAAIDGLVREALVVDVQAPEAVRDAAEEAGARLVAAPSPAAGLAIACTQARGPWLLVLVSGCRLQSGWEKAARAHIERHPRDAAWFDRAADGEGAGARLSEALGAVAAGWLGRPGPRHGLLIPARRVGAVAELDHGALVRAAGRLRRLGVRLLS
jgi:hypothetical protein